MPQAFAHPTKPPRPQRDVKAQDSRRERSSKPPQPHSKGTDHISPRPFKVPTHYSECKRNRMLPELPDPSQWPGPKLEGGVAVAPGSSASRLLPPRANRPTDVSNRMSKLLPAPLVPTQPAQENKSVLGRKQDLDASWYGGKVSRQQAEATLREVNKDGAFVVRDSINGSTEHPYTLMLLNQGKVYNIRIRNQGNFYLLGNGLRNTESFPGVKEMINHHTHTPLLLIDAAHPSSTEQPQCCLLHPAGL
ncbi:lymphocyte cytosolic protein 2 [Odontesthes bonariensis]|uniref:lymphocyte cytosolic protein 2 n=1 Tax=Odontesthes bonariensis TaxID=219752 RepID=UPI003F5889B0